MIDFVPGVFAWDWILDFKEVLDIAEHEKRLGVFISGLKVACCQPLKGM